MKKRERVSEEEESSDLGRRVEVDVEEADFARERNLFSRDQFI